MRNSDPLKRQCFRNEAGYTLFEIMLVLGIITILVGSSIYMLSGNLDVAKERRVETDLRSISTQLSVYEMENYFFPTTEQGLEALVTKPTIEPIPKRWKRLLEAVPLDPWGIPYQYLNPGKWNPESYDLYSWGPDRRESDDDLPRKK
ncbi:MAG: type II secretion system protein GspG [Verrucomicrobia bacterium]|nr:MAG: type II secretion system protein GspG [Verrucomicrobiota bacterium]